MIVSRKGQLLIAACILASSAAYAERGEPTKRQLKFEVPTTPVELQYRFPEAKYVAYFHVKADRRLESWLYGVHDMPQGKEMSEEQRRFIHKLVHNYEYGRHATRKDKGNPFSGRTGGTNTPKGMFSYQILAVSEQDAKKTAAAAIELLDHRAKLRREGNRKELARIRKFIAEAEKALPELEAQVEQLETSTDEEIAEYVKANYGIESDIREHAKKSMNDLSYNLKIVDFDLIGLEAKIDSIQQYKTARKGGDQQTLIKLEQMHIAADVERAGAQAKRAAYEAAFKQANELYALMKSKDAAVAKKHELEKKLSTFLGTLPRAEELVADPPRLTYPVDVHENKVTIYPVQAD